MEQNLFKSPGVRFYYSMNITQGTAPYELLY